MTREELAAQMREYHERRLKLGISSDEFGRELGLSGSTIRSWETLMREPKAVHLAGIEKLLNDLESGRKKLPQMKRPPSLMGTCAQNVKEAGVLLGVIRRLLGIPELVGRRALGISAEEFQRKETFGLKEAEIGNLMAAYAREISGQVRPRSGVQLSFTSLLKDADE